MRRSAWTAKAGEPVAELEGLTLESVREALKDWKYEPTKELERRCEAFRRTQRKPTGLTWFD